MQVRWKDDVLSMHLDLENLLERFYSKHAIKQDLDEWLANHEYSDAIAPENENEWMAT
jgi:hypothetical protein